MWSLMLIQIKTRPERRLRNKGLYRLSRYTLSLQAMTLTMEGGFQSHTPTSLCNSVYHSWQMNASISG